MRESGGTNRAICVGRNLFQLAIMAVCFVSETFGASNVSCKQVDHLADSIIITRGIRKGVVWPAVSLCVVIVAVYILLGLAAWKRPESKTYGRWFNERLSPFVRPATIFLAFLIWMTAACSIILSGVCMWSAVRMVCVPTCVNQYFDSMSVGTVRC